MFITIVYSEIENYGDIVVGDFMDSYENLALKAIFFHTDQIFLF